MLKVLGFNGQQQKCPVILEVYPMMDSLVSTSPLLTKEMQEQGHYFFCLFVCVGFVCLFLLFPADNWILFFYIILF